MLFLYAFYITKRLKQQLKTQFFRFEVFSAVAIAVKGLMNDFNRFGKISTLFPNPLNCTDVPLQVAIQSSLLLFASCIENFFSLCMQVKNRYRFARERLYR